MKEKIGMEKLIELLNEFEEYNKNCEFDEVYNYYPYRVWYEGDFETDLTENCMNIVFIMSKTFGFIKWLVENDKIDLEKVENKFYNEICVTDYGDKDRAYGKSDLVISVLSISDTPIEDLISYLK